MAQNLPGASNTQKDRELASRMRQRRPGYDQVNNLVQDYQGLLQNVRRNLTHDELITKLAHVGFEVKHHIMARRKSSVTCFTLLAHS